MGKCKELGDENATSAMPMQSLLFIPYIYFERREK